MWATTIEGEASSNGSFSRWDKVNGKNSPEQKGRLNDDRTKRAALCSFRFAVAPLNDDDNNNTSTNIFFVGVAAYNNIACSFSVTAAAPPIAVFERRRTLNAGSTNKLHRKHGDKKVLGIICARLYTFDVNSDAERRRYRLRPLRNFETN